MRQLQHQKRLPATNERHYCHDCSNYFMDDNAYEHFNSRTHRMRTKYKIRCVGVLRFSFWDYHSSHSFT